MDDSFPLEDEDVPYNTCTKCMQEKPLDLFFRHRGRPRSMCKTCDNAARRSNEIKNSISIKLKKKARKDLVLEIKKASVCADCQEPDFMVLQFDHVGGQKKFVLSRSSCRSLTAIRDEVKKCVVRCANCHQRITKLRFLAKRESWTMERLHKEASDGINRSRARVGLPPVASVVL